MVFLGRDPKFLYPLPHTKENSWKYLPSFILFNFHTPHKLAQEPWVSGPGQSGRQLTHTPSGPHPWRPERCSERDAEAPGALGERCDPGAMSALGGGVGAGGSSFTSQEPLGVVGLQLVCLGGQRAEERGPCEQQPERGYG